MNLENDFKNKFSYSVTIRTLFSLLSFQMRETIFTNESNSVRFQRVRKVQLIIYRCYVSTVRLQNSPRVSSTLRRIFLFFFFKLYFFCNTGEKIFSITRCSIVEDSREYRFKKNQFRTKIEAFRSVLFRCWWRGFEYSKVIVIFLNGITRLFTWRRQTAIKFLRSIQSFRTNTRVFEIETNLYSARRASFRVSTLGTIY